jgi:hypothetical protein
MKTALVVLFLLFSTKVGYCEDTAFRASMVAAVVAHAADLSVTQRCLGSGRCREVNPWLGRFQQPIPFAVAKMTVASLGLWASAKLHERHPRWALALNIGVAGAYTAITVHNSRVAK